jgi:glutaminyl-peptide cyclotransferase
MVLLDYIAGKGTRLPREGSSDIELWGDLRAAARRVGTSATFPEGVGPTILDDHTPFLERGIPAIDLIDWSYRRHAHTPTDTMEQVSRASLDAVGETVADLLLHWDR